MEQRDSVKKATRQAMEEKMAEEKMERAARVRTYRPSPSEVTENQLRMRALRERTKKALEEKHVSRAKAAGLKSIFSLKDGQMLMTSFGRGNKAVCEKKITGGTIASINNPAAFSAEQDKKRFAISGRVTKNASSDDPSQSSKKSGQDLIGCREQIERLFFGSNFEDNIHIQLAYSILDIDKIMAIHINNIIYELNNMLRPDEFAYTDVVGNIGLDRTYDEFFAPTDSESRKQLQELTRKLLRTQQLSYFGNILYDPALVKKVNSAKGESQKNAALARLNQKERESYSLLSLLGMTRQALAHGEDGPRTAIYQLDPAYDDLYEGDRVKRISTAQRLEARECLDSLYASRVQSLNRGFLSKANVDLRILFSLCDAVLEEEKRIIVREYYDFIVRKEYKNQGFSVKHLRELMLTFDENSNIISKHYDSMRPRLYRLMDFLIFKHYQDRAQKADQFVEALRGTLNAEQKEKLYLQQAREVWNAIRSTVKDGLLPWMEGKELALASKAGLDSEISPDMLADTAIKAELDICFPKLVYLLTCFLDGKEINDLLTTLINKFETISSFIAVMKEQGIPCDFTDGYRMFARSTYIARELRAINSFARMSTPDPDAKRILFVEAAQVLGYPGDKDTLTAYWDSILKKEGKAPSAGSGFRNFIANNVIESDRFKYLVRYANVATVRKLADNRRVIAFVLKDIPDTQIIRYYNSCTGSSDKQCTPAMRGKLADMITGISFEQFKDVKQKATFGADALEKVRKQAVIRLYLTVLYLLVKNLVYVNSRYFLAFHCVERDSIIFDPKYKKAYNGKKDFTLFASDRLESNPPNHRVSEYLKQNFQHSNPIMVTAFRNCADHLGAVRYADLFMADIKHFDSYFELYHYLVQRYLIRDYETASEKEQALVSDKMRDYMGKVKNYRGYCKDMVKALNVPFAYNLPRYKNLSIAELFDRNNYLPNKGKTDELEPEEAADQA